MAEDFLEIFDFLDFLAHFLAHFLYNIFNSFV